MKTYIMKNRIFWRAAATSLLWAFGTVALAAVLTTGCSPAKDPAPQPGSESSGLGGGFEGYWIEKAVPSGRARRVIQISETSVHELIQFSDSGIEPIETGKLQSKSKGQLDCGNRTYRLATNQELEEITHTPGTRATFAKAGRNEAEAAIVPLKLKKKQDYALGASCDTPAGRAIIAQVQAELRERSTSLEEVRQKRRATGVGQDRTDCQLAEDYLERGLEHAEGSQRVFPNQALALDAAALTDLEPIALLEITHLQLKNAAKLKSLAPVAQMRGLEGLIAQGLALGEDKAYAPLAQLRDLRALELEDCDLADYTFLSALPELRLFRISGSQPKGAESLASLAHLPKLERLELAAPHSQTDLTALDALRNAESLKDLVLSAKGTITSWRSLESLTQIAVLSILSSKAEIENFAELKSLQGLRRLYVSHARVRNLGTLEGILSMGAVTVQLEECQAPKTEQAVHGLLKDKFRERYVFDKGKFEDWSAVTTPD